MNLPERFDLHYTSKDNTKKQPVMIHRAILGSFERFIGILTEHYAGEFPLSIAPTGVVIIPIADSHVEYAKQLSKELQEIEIDSEIFDKNDSLNKRIRTAEKQKVPMIVVIGDDEVANSTIALRDRRTRDRSEMGKDEFIRILKEKQTGDKI
jgi:threonyl-tRNA synthetase